MEYPIPPRNPMLPSGEVDTREACRLILQELRGIDEQDLSRAEKNIRHWAQRGLEYKRYVIVD